MNLQLPPELGEEAEDGDIFALELFTDVVLDGVTSGADPTSWDPIRIGNDEEEKADEETVDTSDVTSDKPVDDGVTSGNDTVINGDVKSSERKYKQPNR